MIIKMVNKESYSMAADFDFFFSVSNTYKCVIFC